MIAYVNAVNFLSTLLNTIILSAIFFFCLQITQPPFFFMAGFIAVVCFT